MPKEKAVVVLSGGQDSTTCLYWALDQGYDVAAITFNYGQRHAREIQAAMDISIVAMVQSWRCVDVGEDILVSSSPLTDKSANLEQYKDHASLPGGLEKTFVPMRNQFFLTLAANWAHSIGASVLVTGVCQEDFGGYPDCRRVFIDALETACNLGTFTGEEGALGPLRILTPLMYMTKKQTVELALALPECYGALQHSHTAYDGQYPPMGKDHATLLRDKGFEEAGVPDPLWLRAHLEGKYKLPDTPNYKGDLSKYIQMVKDTAIPF